MKNKLTFLWLLIAATSAPAHTFNMISNVEENKNFPVREFEKMGVTYGWFHCDMPVNMDQQGQPFWENQKLKAKINAVYEKYKDSGIKIFLVVGIWNMRQDYDGAERQQSLWGHKAHYRCFAGDSAKIEKCLGFLTKELAAQKAFGGIGLDDEPSVMAGGSFTSAMISGFKNKYNIAPPTRDDFYHTPQGLIAADHPVLLWLGYQQERMAEFYRKLFDAVQAASPGCAVYFVPSASWISGKTISLPDSPPENAKSQTLGTMDACYIRAFQLYTQYSFTRLTKEGWASKFADGLCQAQFMPPNSPRNVVPIYAPAPDNPDGISVDAFRRYVLQTFAEGANGIGYWPIAAFTPAHIKAAEDIYNSYIKPVGSKTGELKKTSGRIALLFSTSTAALADVWRHNPIERFKHNHQCDALAYYLLKKGIPFDIILENELPKADSLKYYGIISAGVDYLTKQSADELEKYIKAGGKVIFDKESAVNFAGLEKVAFDATAWFRAVEGQYQRESDLRYQCGLLESGLGPYLPRELAICSSSSMQLNINYLTDGTSLYVLAVNDDLFGPIKATLTFEKKHTITDLLADKVLATSDKLLITVPKSGMLVLRLDK